MAHTLSRLNTKMIEKLQESITREARPFTDV